MPFKDPEKRKEYIRKHYQENKEKYKEKARLWEEANPEKIKLRGITRYPKNPEKESKRAKEWIANNLDKHREYARLLARKNRRDPHKIGKIKYSQYKSGSKVRGYIFSLTYQEFMELWGMPCSYCGDNIATIGIDRIDSSIGYSKNNIVPCCKTCNWSKNNHSPEHYIEHCKKVAAKHANI